ncbi:hypothetical protein RIEGSTA812A_PEG_740 [invertebrate metagenome]|uniref:Uncharacterized protein n=1 Tax=invertebrate metagenome TaxID=1711999 RepID=A0A484H5H7_9ZZZZ
MAVHFDDVDVVEDIRLYSLANSYPVVPVQRITPTAGRRLSWLQQLLGNIGRFNRSRKRRAE